VTTSIKFGGVVQGGPGPTKRGGKRKSGNPEAGDHKLKKASRRWGMTHYIRDPWDWEDRIEQFFRNS